MSALEVAACVSAIVLGTVVKAVADAEIQAGNLCKVRVCALCQTPTGNPGPGFFESRILVENTGSASANVIQARCTHAPYR